MPTSSALPKKAASSLKTAVAIDKTAHRQLAKAATQLGISNGEFASAAISYFTERGLNPVSDREREGLVIQNKIHDLEKVVTTLGNRLFGWLTQHEKNLNRELFGFLRGHEKTLFTYLQGQATAMHEHLNDQEDLFLHSLMRQTIIGSVDSFYARRLTEQIMLQVSGLDVKKEYLPRHNELNAKRDALVEKTLNEFVAGLAPGLTPPPAIPAATPLPERKPAVSPDTPVVKNPLSEGLPDSF